MVQPVTALSPTEYLLTKLKLSLWLGLTASFIPLLWESYRFIAPGLKKQELRWLRTGLIPGVLLFYGGLGFGVLLIAPLALRVLSAWTPGIITNLWSISKVVKLFVSLGLGLGLIFEFPLVLIILDRIGLLKQGALGRGRKYVYIAILLFAAMITPPDVISQVLAGVPLIILYELTALILAHEKQRRGK